MSPVASTTNNRCQHCGKERAQLGTIVIKGCPITIYKDRASRSETTRAAPIGAALGLWQFLHAEDEMPAKAVKRGIPPPNQAYCQWRPAEVPWRAIASLMLLLQRDADLAAELMLG